VTEPAFRCPIVADGERCDVAIPAKHWACRRHWLLFPVRFRNNANRYTPRTPEWHAMIERANTLLSSDDSDDLRPPWRRRYLTALCISARGTERARDRKRNAFAMRKNTA
jgi:hypothetical protein